MDNHDAWEWPFTLGVREVSFEVLVAGTKRDHLGCWTLRSPTGNPQLLPRHGLHDGTPFHSVRLRLFLDGAQDDDRYLAVRPTLVVLVSTVHRDEPRPQPLLLLGRRLLCPRAKLAASDLDVRLRIGSQVRPPGGVSGCPTVRSDDDKVLAIFQVEERDGVSPAGLAPRGYVSPKM